MDWNIRLRKIMTLLVITIGIWLGIYVYSVMKHAMTIQNKQVEDMQRQIGE